jgi:hypothetical protein
LVGGRFSHLYIQTTIALPLYTRSFFVCCTRWIAAHISTDLAACCTLRPRPIPTRTIHPPHTSHLNLVETSLSRCCFPLASRLARTARRHLEARQRRGSPGTTPQYPSPDRHRPHALPLLYHLATPSPRIAARDPETSSVPSHTTSHARSHVSKACTYRLTRPSGSGNTPAPHNETRPTTPSAPHRTAASPAPALCCTAYSCDRDPRKYTTTLLPAQRHNPSTATADLT